MIARESNMSQNVVKTICAFFVTLFIVDANETQEFEEMRKLQNKGATVETVKTNGDFHVVSVRWDGVHLKKGDLASLNSFSWLKAFKSRHSRIEDEALLPLSLCKEITELDVGGSQITDKGLAALEKTDNLTILNLWSNNVKGEGLKYISQHKQLKILDLSGNPLKDEGLDFIRSCANLTVLRLTRTNITDVGWKQNHRRRSCALTGIEGVANS
jgi:Leucine Rich repeat